MDEKVPINSIFLNNCPILQQLQLEEALLRTSSENFCLINTGSTPAIVMGISGKEQELIEHSKWILDPIPIIRRFSGGGTVVVDENTLFLTFIFNSLDINVPCRIDLIHRYLESFWKLVFPDQAFSLIENDYCVGEKKAGGNAQYLTKNRWLHHTSFLWDFAPQKMKLLSYPPKTPSYRKGRSHLDFLTTLSNCFTSKEFFLENVKNELLRRFSVFEITYEQCLPYLVRPHRKQSMEVILQKG